VKWFVLIAVIYIVFRVYRIGLINGSSSEKEKINRPGKSEAKDSNIEYSDYEEIK
jgi:hypothetical protein